MASNTFNTRSTLQVADKTYTFFDITRLPEAFNLHRLPFSLRSLLENVLRFEDGVTVTAEEIKALLAWSPKKPSDDEIAFTPARVILQDFTGVPAVVDLAAMRDAMTKLGGNPNQINPLSPVELVIDHSVMVDFFGNKEAFQKNVAKEFERNQERYAFLRWGQTAFQNFKVVPPGTGIVHQVNLEYLARVVFHTQQNGALVAYPDTLVGTDSHTTMINGLGVLGWGVGGIEAEAAMLGQPITMLIPEVIGCKLIGKLKEGTTATDLVLTVTEILRKKKVVGKFVEFYGDGLDHLPLADRATIANMAPEYGATCAFFPVDNETIRYLRLSGRSEADVALVEAYYKAQGLFRTSGSKEATYSEHIFLDLSTISPCIAGPKRPQDRLNLSETKQKFQELLKEQAIEPRHKTVKLSEKTFPLQQGAVVIAAITSCTNTSNPEVMIGSALLARNALAKGLQTKPWVKTSFAPGSKLVTDYLENAGLMSALDALGFNLVGYGCTTCIGNSGPLPEPISAAIKEEKLAVTAVLSGNRNFEGRIHPDVRFAYLASPPLVIAYALAGTMDIDLYREPLGTNARGESIFLKDIWPSPQDIHAIMEASIKPALFTKRYAEVFAGDPQWQALDIPIGKQFTWQEHSTYIKCPPFFAGIEKKPPAIENVENARVLVLLGDSVTTDHISPAGSIAANSPAGLYLQSLGVNPRDFNSYGARRGNHEVMVRGTFANPRLNNKLLKDEEGNVTLHMQSGQKMSIYDASIRYQAERCPLIIIAGKEYGTGSSRDWAAKGTRLLGVRVVIAESFERIHRSNLIGMGILPLQFMPDENRETLKLTGKELYSLAIKDLKPKAQIKVTVKTAEHNLKTFSVVARIDTPQEWEYFQHGGILPYVLRQLVNK
jgi:aconitate hydratase